MYDAVLIIHSFFKWLVFLALGLALYRAYKGYYSGARFTRVDNMLRHWTATIAHIQLIFGVVLYSKSPVISFFWHNAGKALKVSDISFFALTHLLLMISGITVLTIGSALAKRKKSDPQKFKTIAIWFTLALIIIFIALPWPFSPLASRPLFRTF